jgi:uroporphyrinogen-III synthase
MKRVLVTGPLDSLSDYCAAARAAGWEAVEMPLQRVVPHRHDVSEILHQRFDWIAVTSSNALSALSELCRASSALRQTPCAIVGARSSARGRELGLSVALTSADASALGRELARLARPGARVLWPRGHLSDQLARDLREHGLVVVDPVVYSTQPLAAPRREAERSGDPARDRTVDRTDDRHLMLSAADAIFFASPSAVRAWHANAHATTDRGSTPIALPRVAIAIGATTFEALMSERDIACYDTISLPEPTPEAFGFVLAHLGPGGVEPTP